MSPLANEVHKINQDAARIRAIRKELEQSATSCQCDYDGDSQGYTKTSRYCPEHDDCESCGERKGVAKDPSFPAGYDRTRINRPFWMCHTCLDEMCPVCGMDLEGGCKGHQAQGPGLMDLERAIYNAKVIGGRA